MPNNYPPLEKVLARVSSPRTVELAKQKRPTTCLVHAVSLESGQDEKSLLAKAAKIYSLEPVFELRPPTYLLVEAMGYDAETLIQKNALPQPFRSSYSVAVSDPSYVNRDYFESLGIPILLGREAQIKSLWKTYLIVLPNSAEQEHAFNKYRDYVKSLTGSSTKREI